MAKQKIQDKVESLLTKPREVFKNELLDRIKIGENYLKNSLTINQETLDNLNTEVYNWNDYNKELIKRAFNIHNNEYFNEYSRLNQSAGLGDYLRGVDTSSLQYKIQLSENIFKSYISWLKRLVDKLPLIQEVSAVGKFNTMTKTIYNRGFMVHGHNQARKLEVARFIENNLHRKIIILHEQANKGQTIIEKFESYSSVDFAVALWTADDDGKAKTQLTYQDRTRQNVIFETGFFIGKLGRQHVIVLYENGVEIPSDYSGVIFISLADNWKDDLRKEIEVIYEEIP